jgi:hypothetical protein
MRAETCSAAWVSRRPRPEPLPQGAALHCDPSPGPLLSAHIIPATPLPWLARSLTHKLGPVGPEGGGGAPSNH